MQPAVADSGELMRLDTAGCDMEELQEDEGDSISNAGEAQVWRRPKVPNSWSGLTAKRVRKNLLHRVLG